MEKLVSIITPAYNCSNFIPKTVESVLNQTYQNWEMIIIDDGSTDNTIKLIKEYQAFEKRIHFFALNENRGAAVARNNGIKFAKGTYIAFLDSDDLWHPQKLEKQLNLMEINNSVFSHTSYSLFDENGKALHIKSKCNKWVSFNDLVKYNWIGTSTVIYNASVLGKHYMPDLRNRQDWALWIKLIKISKRALFIDEPLTKYTVRLNSISSNKAKLIKFHWVVYRKVLKFNIFLSVFYLIHNLYYHLMKVKYVNIQPNAK